MSAKKLTSEDRLFFVKDFLSSGCTVKEWAESFGIHKATLYSWLKEFDIQPSSASCPIDSADSSLSSTLNCQHKQLVA